MSGLVDARGNPLQTYATKPKEKKPRVGDAFGQWAGRDEFYARLPGGAVLQFDLSKLTLADYRQMRQHYQLGASLNVLSFVLHQIDWQIECESKEAKDFIETDLNENWTPLTRAISQSFWAGYSPNAINYKNEDGSVKLDRIKDLVPEESRVKWAYHDGWAPDGTAKPKIHTYNGLTHNGHWIPPENTLWYPLLMENGDHYGRKLLKPAFPAWFFSQLIHLFANRYFERFGEPLPIGRARFEDQVDVGDGTTTSGKAAMEGILGAFRNRASVVLPSDRDPQSGEYDFDISYLESQMRGADFERYLGRLDEEMSLSVFTPVLLFRTADVGSYNLGQAHLRIFQQMLNAISGDMQYYLQNYLVDRMNALNFPGGPKARWVYRKQGQGDIDTYKELMVELVRQGQAEPDLKELSAITGLKWEEAEQLIAPPEEPGIPDVPLTDEDKAKAKASLNNATRIAYEAAKRVANEVGKGRRDVSLGFRNRFMQALSSDGGFSQDHAQRLTDQFYGKMNLWLDDVVPLVEGGEHMKTMIHRVVDAEIESLA